MQPCTLPLCTAMNEATWRQVLVWERLHASDCQTPTLLKFRGRPHDLRYATSGTAGECCRPAAHCVQNI